LLDLPPSRGRAAERVRSRKRSSRKKAQRISSPPLVQKNILRPFPILDRVKELFHTAVHDPHTKHSFFAFVPFPLSAEFARTASPRAPGNAASFADGGCVSCFARSCPVPFDSNPAYTPPQFQHLSPPWFYSAGKSFPVRLRDATGMCIPLR